MEFIKNLINIVKFDSLYSYIILAIIIYVIAIIILSLVHKKVLKQKRELQKECVWEYDNLRYLVAKARSKSNKQSELELWLKNILNSGKKLYLKNYSLIKEEVWKIEELLWSEIISKDIWSKIEDLQKKISNKDKSQKTFGWILTIITIGGYKIFWCENREY